jgi:Fe-S-cluster containining protein
MPDEPDEDARAAQRGPAGTPPSEDERPWYHEGLKFTCTQCGHCCTGDPGFTWVSESEIAALALRLGIDESAFRKRYTRVVWRGGEQRVTLLEQRGGDCVFYKRGTGCTVYEQRPKQCRTWPFWNRVVGAREDWLIESRGCPGMGKGALHTAAEISATAADDGL